MIIHVSWTVTVIKYKFVFWPFSSNSRNPTVYRKLSYNTTIKL